MSFIPDFSGPSSSSSHLYRIPDDEKEVEAIEWSMVARKQELQAMTKRDIDPIAEGYGLRTTHSKKYVIPDIVRYERSQKLREYRTKRSESFLAETYGPNPERVIEVSYNLARFIAKSVRTWSEVSQVRLGTEAATSWIGRSVRARKRMELANRLLLLAGKAQPARYNYATGKYETEPPLGIKAVEEVKNSLIHDALFFGDTSGSLWTHANFIEERKAIAEFISEVLS